MLTNKPSLKAVFFDLDGTLLDTSGDLGGALNYVLSQYNLPQVKQENYAHIAGDGALALIEYGFGAKLSQFDIETIRQDFLRYYFENIAENTHIYQGVSSLINALDKTQTPWGIITNKPQYLTEKLFPCFPVFSASKTLIGGDFLPQRKPHPAQLLYACEQLKIDPKACIYVGDALRDIQAGNAANMFTIVAKWGLQPTQNDYQQWQADFIAEHPEQILDFLSI